MGNPAARKGDMTMHTTGLNGACCTKVKIKSKDAWRVGDFHSCSMQNQPPAPGPPIPHVGGSVLKGSFTVLVGSQPAARQFDIVLEPAAAPPTVPFLPNNTIQMGEMTVKIGDIGFGLMDPAILAQFCADWAQLLQDWAGLSPAERQARMEQMTNNALQAAGGNGHSGMTDTAPASAQGQFNPATNQINMPNGIFNNNTPPAGAVGATIIHEAQHVNQFFANAQLLAGQGQNAAQIAANTGLPQTVAQAAQAAPAAANTATGQLGAMNQTQTYGAYSAYNNQARNYTTSAYNAHGAASPQYADALNAYYGLPNERNAEDAADALRAMCPQAN